MKTSFSIASWALLLSQHTVEAGDINKCFKFCATKIATENCMNICRFMHKDSSEGAVIGDNSDKDLGFGSGLNNGGNDEEALLDENGENEEYEIASTVEDAPVASPGTLPTYLGNSDAAEPGLTQRIEDGPAASPEGMPTFLGVAPRAEILPDFVAVNKASDIPSDSPSTMPSSASPTVTVMPPAQIPTPVLMNYTDVKLPTVPTDAPISPTRPPRAQTPTATPEYASDGLVSGSGTDPDASPVASPVSSTNKDSVGASNGGNDPDAAGDASPVASPVSSDGSVSGSGGTGDAGDETTTSDASDAASEPSEAPEELFDCLWDKKVAYQCGQDTFVCNADEVFTALEVCDQQPVPEDGGMFDWHDTGSSCSSKSKTRDIDVDCWCHNMQKGVLAASESEDESFPTGVLCPNYEHVTSYVCYFPRLGGASYKVNRLLEDSGSGDFVEECTGFQPRNELPPVEMPVMMRYEAMP